MYYCAFVMADKIDQIQGCDTEQELDQFAIEMTSFTDEEKQEREAEGNDYGPPIVFAFLVSDSEAAYKNNFERPFAVYLRGERYDCVKHNP
ncbi:MAG: hypothetical protein K8L91_12300 [Anaerolineae bacterium]|nr:hypothetical protein [Anaerolineae bacterium]